MTSVLINRLSKSFAGLPVLDDVGMEIPDGSVLALLGPSGCGKTTLLRLIAGFERADAGEIALGTLLVESGSRRIAPERRRIGYVPQEGALFPHLTVAGNVGYGLSRRERKGPRIGEVLELVGLGAFADRYPHQLSGGQQQRVALARALAPKPRLILLDEPFNALDLDLRRSMCEDVAALLRRTGTTALLVTHDPVEAFATADLVAVMQSGRIIQCDTPSAVYQNPLSETVARLTGDAIFLEGTILDDGVGTPLGLLPIRNGRSGLSGRAIAMLRPEQVVPAGNGHGCKATVVNRRFRGDHTILEVAGEGFALTVRAQGHAQAHGHADDDVVRLRVRGGCIAFEPTSEHRLIGRDAPASEPVSRCESAEVALDLRDEENPLAAIRLLG